MRYIRWIMSTYKALCCSKVVKMYTVNSFELYLAGDVCTCANGCILLTEYNKIQPIVIVNKCQGGNIRLNIFDKR